MENKIILTCLLHYSSFAIFFYLMFTIGPLDFKIKYGNEEIENERLKKMYKLIFSLCWIIGIPLLIKNSKKN